MSNWKPLQQSIHYLWILHKHAPWINRKQLSDYLMRQTDDRGKTNQFYLSISLWE
jgi:hypothetical protein